LQAVSFVDPFRTTASAILPSRLADAPLRRALQLSFEACFYTLLSCGLLVVLGLAEGGIMSIFLVSAPLTDRLVTLLEENPTAIYVLGVGGRRANQRTAAGLLWLFTGIAIGYGLVVVWLGEGQALRTFAFAARAAELDGGDLLGRSFGSVVGLVGNNLGVALVVLCLGFAYRAYGVMLALTWNACAWACVLTVLISRAAAAGVESRLVLLGAVLPHLVSEAIGYVLIALGAIFASKALSTYDLGEPAMRGALRASGVLVAVGVAALALAALIEAVIVPGVLAGVAPG
jgi:hypothetical protein